ncbi:MAG: hypothetical protein JWM12_180 [Ilumatobacteraceae bacterium]|jgi:hypothetical protein|nr:hypothetical protein [Ilumatobacteraceae bacterium]
MKAAPTMIVVARPGTAAATGRADHGTVRMEESR